MDYDMVKQYESRRIEVLFYVSVGLKISRKKAVLVARVFSAMENNVMPIKTAEEVENEISQEYQNKLKLNDIEIPDPFKLEENWIGNIFGSHNEIKYFVFHFPRLPQQNKPFLGKHKVVSE